VSRVKLQEVSKTFYGPNGRSVVALQRVCLELTERELLALVGPSGGGKTTTLRLIAGLEAPDAGTISLNGRDVNGVPPAEREVAMVFQSHALFPHLTAFENLALGMKLRRVPKAEAAARVRETAELLGLTECLERRPAELSGGQRQRVALGRAIVRRPRVLLLDEPLSNLDAPLRRELRRELLRLHRELELTTLLVTHDPAEAMALGERVAVMNAGVIEQVATPAELRARPATQVVAAFLDPSVI
jgi:ABC-type sugar transport system ATPase subunit